MLSNSPSGKISNKFDITLPPDTADWFDSGIYKKECYISYGEPLEPECLLSSEPEVIWGGQMLPDTLPILANGCGDALFLRFDKNGSVSEIVEWFHESGSWSPYGKSLAESVIYSTVRTSEEEGDGPVYDEDDDEDYCFGNDESPLLYAEWALKWLFPDETKREIIMEMLKSKNGNIEEMLLKEGIAEIPIRRDRCKNLLNSGFNKYCCLNGGVQLTERIGVEWEIARCWLEDPDLIPEKYLSKIAKITGLPRDELVHIEWAAAANEAQAVLDIRDDLLWPYAVLGRAAEKRGDFEQAVEYYRKGMEKPFTTADMTETWTHGNTEWGETYMLRALRDIGKKHPELATQSSYYNALEKEYSASFGDFPINAYWKDLAEKAEEDGRFDEAYNFYYNSGWDSFAANYTDEALKNLIRASKKGGFDALHKIASYHYKSI